MTEYFDCICDSHEHTIRFMFDDFEDEEPTIYTSVFLNQYYPWYKRVISAIKYIFGYKCKYGHFDVWELKVDDVDRLSNFLDKFKQVNK